MFPPAVRRWLKPPAVSGLVLKIVTFVGLTLARTWRVAPPPPPRWLFLFCSPYFLGQRYGIWHSCLLIPFLPVLKISSICDLDIRTLEVMSPPK